MINPQSPSVIKDRLWMACLLFKAMAAVIIVSSAQVVLGYWCINNHKISSNSHCNKFLPLPPPPPPAPYFHPMHHVKKKVEEEEDEEGVEIKEAVYSILAAQVMLKLYIYNQLASVQSNLMGIF